MKNQTSAIISMLVILGIVLNGCTVYEAASGSIRKRLFASPFRLRTMPLEFSNPASKNCEQNGFQVKIRTASDGSQSVVCIFPDGTACDEWAYLRGECGPTPIVPVLENQASEAARSRLAEELGIDPSEVELISMEKITWQDSCLEIPMEGETCRTVVTPGFRVVFIVGEKPYVYNTDLTGENIRLDIHGPSYP